MHRRHRDSKPVLGLCPASTSRKSADKDAVHETEGSRDTRQQGKGSRDTRDGCVRYKTAGRGGGDGGGGVRVSECV